MNDFIFTTEMLIMLLPLLVVQLGLAIYSITKIVREGVANLNRPIWIVISLFFSMIGPITFLIVGRKRDV